MDTFEVMDERIESPSADHMEQSKSVSNPPYEMGEHGLVGAASIPK
jgi:hypothetical protein